MGRDRVGRAVIVGGCERFLGEEVVEVAREVALERAERSFLGLALGLFASEVFLGGGVALGAGGRDHVQRVVELAVPAAVEPMLGALPGGARDRRGPGLQREARVGAEPFVAGGVADQDRAVTGPQPCSASNC